MLNHNVGYWVLMSTLRQGTKLVMFTMCTVCEHYFYAILDTSPRKTSSLASLRFKPLHVIINVLLYINSQCFLTSGLGIHILMFFVNML